MTGAIQVVTTTANRDEALKIAEHLIELRLAACVQVSGPIESVYRWSGQIERSSEWVCTAKSLATSYDQIEHAIRDIHAYDEPEIIVVPIEGGSDGYLKWLAEQVGS